MTTTRSQIKAWIGINKMALNSLREIVNYLAEMPSEGNLDMYVEDYFADEPPQGEEYDASRAEIKKDEGGFKAQVYLDTEGYPTIGVGHKLLPSEIAEYGAEAKYKYTDEGKELMRRDFTRKGKLKTWTPEEGEVQYNFDFDKHYKETQAAYNHHRGMVNGMSWGELPQEARYTFLNMGYNMGGAGLRNKFPGMLKAAARGQWELAAHELKYKSGARVLGGGNSLYSTYFAQLSGGRVGWDQEVHPHTGRPIRKYESIGEDGKTYTWEETEMRGHMEINGEWVSFPTLDWDGTKYEDYGKAYRVAAQNKEVKTHKTAEEARTYNEQHSTMLGKQLENARAKPLQAARSHSQFGRLLGLAKPKKKTDPSNTAQGLQNELKGGLFPVSEQPEKRIKERAKQDIPPQNVTPNKNNRPNYLEGGY
jgi:GH24 family phage-related lysozyme (muramidase)